MLFFSSLSIVGCYPKQITCQTGEPVILQKSADKLYRSYAKETETGVKGTISVLEDVAKLSDLDLSVKSKVVALRDKLDQYSSRFQEILKTQITMWYAAPCDKNVREKCLNLLDQMSKDNTAMESLRQSVQNQIQAGHIGGINDKKVETEIETFNKVQHIDKIIQ